MMYWNVYWIISPELACSCPMIVPPPRSHKYECQFQECFPLPGISHRTKYCFVGAIVIILRPHYLSICIFVMSPGDNILVLAFITQVSPCCRKGSCPSYSPPIRGRVVCNWPIAWRDNNCIFVEYQRDIVFAPIYYCFVSQKNSQQQRPQ